jgi:uncharacterized protein
MKFNRKARLDTSQIQDRRGRGGGGSGFRLPTGRGGGGLPIPAGGGIGGIVVVVILAVVAMWLGGVGPWGGGSDSSGGSRHSLATECRTGADTGKQECAVVDDVNNIQAFWSKALPRMAHRPYRMVKTVYYTGSTSSGCGQAATQMGPFYCPVDKLVYLDLSFFHDMLQGQLGAKGGPFADAYVVAHEYGHHVQDLLGTLGRYQSRKTGPTSPSVRIELQADCYAGVWAHYATTVKASNGQPFISDVTRTDISDAIDAATAVGDDRIQQETQGRVTPEQWTHGSSAERVAWFTKGYRTGSMSACNTFAPNAL